MSVMPPVISQRDYPGAGDIDDCWAVASIWAETAANPGDRRPTVPQFRAACHNPDKPGPTAGDLDDIIRASAVIWPTRRLIRYHSTEWAGFADHVRAGGIASLAVLSAALPAALRFRFLGTHQVGIIAHNGAFYLANPLAPDGSQPLLITESNLRAAARAVANGWILAALYQPAAPAGGDMAINTRGLTLASSHAITLPDNTPIYAEPGPSTVLGRVTGTAEERAVPYFGTSGAFKAVRVNFGQGSLIGYTDSAASVYAVPAAPIVASGVQAPDVKHTVTLQIDGVTSFTKAV